MFYLSNQYDYITISELSPNKYIGDRDNLIIPKLNAICVLILCL